MRRERASWAKAAGGARRAGRLQAVCSRRTQKCGKVSVAVHLVVLKPVPLPRVAALEAVDVSPGVLRQNAVARVEVVGQVHALEVLVRVLVEAGQRRARMVAAPSDARVGPTPGDVARVIGDRGRAHADAARDAS